MIFPDMGFQLNFSEHETVIRIGCFLDVRYARFWKMILNPFEKG